MVLSEDLGSRITAITPYDNGLTLIAQPDAGVISAYNQNNMMVSPFLTELSGGGVLGPVAAMAVDGDANIYMATEDGRIVLYDSPDGAEPAVTVSLYNLPDTPTSIALGQVPVPADIDQGDEGLVLYYGTSTGNVMQMEKLIIDPWPSCPLSFAPQHHAFPDETAQVKLSAASTQLDSPAGSPTDSTGKGTSASLTPAPSWSASLLPQHQTSPWATAHECP